MLNAELIVAQLKSYGITHAVGLSDTSLARVFELLDADPATGVVPVCREGEAFAIAAGLYIGGGRPVVLIQNTGFLESGDAVRGTVVNMKLPVITLIAYRGYGSLHNEKAWTDTAASFLEPTLEAWGLPYVTVKRNEELPLIGESLEAAMQRSAPAAVLLVGKCV